MPENYEYDDLDDDDLDDNDPEAPPTNEERVTLKREDAKRMRGAARRTKALEQELQALRREVAFERAGVDLSTKAGQFFAKNYDGDDFTPDKIREEAEELGVPLMEGAAASKKDGPDPEPGEDASTKERQNLAAGGAPDDGKAPRPDPKEESLKKGKELIKAGASEAEAIAGAISVQAQAAMDGDERAFIQPSF